VGAVTLPTEMGATQNESARGKYGEGCATNTRTKEPTQAVMRDNAWRGVFIMPRRQSAPVPLTPGQAVYVLERLVRERVVAPMEVRRYVSEMGSEIQSLEARLYKLREAFGNGAKDHEEEDARKPQQRRPRRATVRRNVAKQLGGRFAGLIRRLPSEERSQYHAIKERDGVEAAIKALQNRKSARD
jgi:hypothetical protein